MSRGPRGAAASALSLRPPLYQQAIFPSAFRLQVGWSAQEPPFKFFPAEPGIPDQLAQRTWPFLPVIRRRNGTEELGVMADVRALTGQTGFSSAVILTNLFMLPERFDEFLALPKEVFDSAEELLQSGWRVD